MLKTTYGKFQALLLMLPLLLAVPYWEVSWPIKAGVTGGWMGLVLVLMDIKGLLLWPKESRMELDPEYKAKMERDGTAH